MVANNTAEAKPYFERNELENDIIRHTNMPGIKSTRMAIEFWKRDMRDTSRNHYRKERKILGGMILKEINEPSSDHSVRYFFVENGVNAPASSSTTSRQSPPQPLEEHAVIRGPSPYSNQFLP